MSYHVIVAKKNYGLSYMRLFSYAHNALYKKVLLQVRFILTTYLGLIR